MLKNLKKDVKSLEQRAYEAIRESILTGEFEPEDRLTEEQMAKDLGVSRTTIQRAFIRLKDEHLLEGTPFKGVQVISASLDEALEAYDVREMLEGYGSRIAARYPNEKQVSEMIKGFEKLESSGVDLRGPEFQTLNFSFHRMIANSYKNKAIPKMLATLIMKSKSYHQKCQVKYFYSEGSLQEHLDILHAIKDGDENRAARLTGRHINNIKKSFINVLKEISKKAG